MTNISGKFAAPTSHKTSDSQESQKLEAVKYIPQVPKSNNDILDEVRTLFGKFWWLWLVVFVWWLSKSE